MRLLVYGLNYAPEPTGTGKYTGEMARWLASRGHEVDAIAAPPHYPEWRVAEAYRARAFHRERLDGVLVHRAPLYVPPKDRLTGARRILLESTFTLGALRHWIPVFAQRRKYDAVVCVCPPMQIALYPWLYRALRGVPWVFHVQDLQVDAAFRLGILRGGAFEHLLFKLESFFLRKATCVSTITEAMRCRLVEKGVERERAWVVPNWSDLEFVKPGPRMNLFRRDVLAASEQDVMLIYAGSMGKKQGLDLIVQAADRLRNEPRFRFAIVGSGADEPRIRALADELKPPNLRFLPVQPVERLPEVLAAADVHLVVQKRDAADLVMPSKLTNILAAGRCSIATADPGTALHQVLAEHHAGLVTPVDDLVAFVSAVRTLADDSDLRDRMGGNARAYAERHLAKDAVLAGLEEKLMALTEEKAR